MRRRWLAVLLLAAGCASAPVRDADVLALSAADALILEGCYDCLLEARDTYARVGVGLARPLVVARLFEAEILIALREKELAIASADAEARAAAMSAELPVEFGADRLLRIVDAVLPDAMGVSRRRFRDLTIRPERRALQVDEELAWLAASSLSPPVRHYVAAAFDCSYDSRPVVVRGQPPTRARGEKPRLALDAPPLLRYRIAICFGVTAPALEAVRAGVPRFVETGYFLSRLKMATVQNDGAPGTREVLDEVAARFSRSPSVAYLTGNLVRLSGDCRGALTHYDRTLALEAEHEDAMLGRTVCLSFLKEHAAAMAAATTLLEWGAFNLPEAYYWRAWNQHVLQNLPPARADIESAKKIAATGDIFTLAGIIEHDQDDLPVAEKDLLDARKMSFGERNCVAAWYLGLVHMKQKRWLESSSAFEDAMRCYQVNVLESEAGLRAMQRRTEIDVEFKARQIAGFEAAITEDRNQYHAAAFNVANQGAQGGDIARARAFLEVAARGTDPSLLKLVQQLRDLLK